MTLTSQRQMDQLITALTTYADRYTSIFDTEGNS